MPVLTKLSQNRLLSQTVRSIQRGKHFKVAVVGGGAGGLAVASTLSEKLGSGSVGVIEPSRQHYYQPGWTLVAGGMMDSSQTVRPTIEVMPPKAKWIQHAAASFAPEQNKVVTDNGEEITYDFLVVAAGMQLNWSKISGLEAALKKDNVTSNYDFNLCQKTAKMMDAFEGGKAIFTQPNVPIKCAGAPQKIMYIFEDVIRKRGLRSKSEVTFMQGMPGIFAIKKYADALTQICKERNIRVNCGHVLTSIDGDKSQATFQAGDNTLVVDYDFIHVTPPMGPPAFLANSPLAAANGWVDVDQYSLQHNKYPNVFALGDCANLPTSKTAAAVADESNLLAALAGKALPEKYDGYASCPLVVGVDKLILAEFSAYTGQPKETLFMDQSVPSSTMFKLKRDVMPTMYWEQLLAGTWEGPRRLRALLNPFNWN